MTGPKRLRDLQSLGPMERLALEEARMVEPPAELRDEVWKALEAAILPAAATAATVGALSEGASAGSHAAATTVAGGKAAVGAATHMGFAVIPALKVVATAAIVLGSTAGVGFAVGRGWSALTETGAPEEARVAEGRPPRATSVVAASTAAARGAPASTATDSGVHEPLPVENAGNQDEARAVTVPASSAVAPATPRVEVSQSTPAAQPVGMSRDGDAAAALQPVGSSAARAESPVPGRVIAEPSSAASWGAAAPVVSTHPSTGGAIYGADQESLVASEAREALRAGDPRRSLALLQRLQSLGGRGVLAEERGLLEIEALVRLGDRDAARERARAFLGTWPESVYAGRVQAMLRGL